MPGVNLHYQAAEAFARAMASNVNLRVVVDKSITTAATDGERLLIRPYEPHWQPGSDMDIIWYGLVAHECFHNLPENRADLFIENKDERLKNPLFGTVHNILVDHNIEAGAKGRWLGADAWIKQARNTFNQLQKVELPKNKLEKSATQKLHALAKLDGQCRNNWQGTALRIDPDETSLAWYEKIKHLREEYETVRAGGAPNLELTQKIYDLLELDKEHQELSKQAEERVAQAMAGLDNHLEQEGPGPPQEVLGKYIDGEGNLKDTKGEAHANPEPEFKTRGYKPRQMIEKNPDPTGTFVIGEITHLSKKLVRRLQIFSRKRYQGGYRRGKLYKKRLTRAVIQGDTRVFRQKNEEIIKDTAVLLLVDCSGSMSGEKYRYAASSALSLIDVLDKNQINVGAFGFSYTDRPVHVTFKDFGDKANLTNIDGKFNKAQQWLGDNSDGDNILHCYKLLKKQKQKRKVMIVLSDGRPCAPADGCGIWAKDVIKSVDTDPYIELYGIGICDNHVKELYKNAAVIHNPQDLEKVLLRQLETIIIS